MKQKNIYIISTGGTIAGVAERSDEPSRYQAGVLSMQSIFQQFSAYYEHYHLVEVPLMSIDSAHMEMEKWIYLAQEVQATASRPDCAAIIITHGTDTLEETAFFLDVTLSVQVPVVMVAAMRPANAISADGPLNLLHALRVASDSSSFGRGVLVVMDGTIFAGTRLTKFHTQQVGAFYNPFGGPLGVVRDTGVHWYTAVTPRLFEPLPIPSHCPRVEILFSYAGAQPLIEENSAALDGLVIAGTGHGTMSLALEAMAQKTQALGKPVVVSSRVPEGGVSMLHFKYICAGFLNPFQARVLLLILLAENYDNGSKIKKYFSLCA